LNFYW